MNKFKFQNNDNLTHSIFEIIFSLAMVRFVILALLLVFMAPIAEKNKTSDETNRGNIRIEVIWESNKDVDVDVWVKAPNDRPVGWSNKNGKVFDLVRDDLGNINDPLGVNYEIVYSRGAPKGEYVVNIHLWANREPNYSKVPVNVVITYSKEDGTKHPKKQLIRTIYTLSKVQEEVTIARFKIGDDGEIDENSLNTVYKPLYGVVE